MVETELKNELPDAPSFINRLLDQTPNWSLGAIGSLLALALTLKILGIDFAGPINQVTAAYTAAIERQAAGMLKFDEATTRMETLIAKQQASIDATNTAMGAIMERLKEAETSIDGVLEGVGDIQERIINHEDRIQLLEKDAHPATHKQ